MQVVQVVFVLVLFYFYRNQEQYNMVCLHHTESSHLYHLHSLDLHFPDCLCVPQRSQEY